MRFLIFFLILCSPYLLRAQPYQLTGTIVNGEDDQPVDGASIFINSASGGTISGKDGHFSLSGIAFHKFELVISHVAFETLVVPITPENIGRRFLLRLAPKQAELEAVVVAPVEKNGWEKWGGVFTRNFIGMSDLAQNCVIKNPEVLRFRYNSNTTQLKVTSTDRLIIENKTLGYIINFQLEEFVYNSRQGMVSHYGYTSFTQMQSSRKRKIDNWKKARQEAFNGSLMHFMRSIYANTIFADSFELRSLQRIYKQDSATRPLYDALMHGNVSAIDTSRYSVQLMRPSGSMQPPIVYIYGKYILPTDSIRRFDTADQKVKLFFQNDLVVRYKNELEKPEYTGLGGRRQKQHSIIYFVQPDPVTIEASGLYFNPLNIFTEDYWAWEKIAEMLPVDYQPGD